jgi:hypothetical protein
MMKKSLDIAKKVLTLLKKSLYVVNGKSLDTAKK